MCKNPMGWCRTLTFFEEGNHFINNILELPIRPAEEKNIYISSRQREIYFLIVQKAAIHLLIESTEKGMHLSAVPDVVKRLCLMDDDAARRTPVAVEKVLHDAAFTNWHRNKHKSKPFLEQDIKTGQEITPHTD